jgi:hypothetical protein
MLGGGEAGVLAQGLGWRWQYVDDFWFVPEDWARARGGMEMEVEGRKRGTRPFGFSIAIY